MWFQRGSVLRPGLSVTFDPMGKMFQDAKVDRNSKITTTAGHSFYIGPIGSFYLRKYKSYLY
jgi:hypothetical protein